jgi:hypothetical protein
MTTGSRALVWKWLRLPGLLLGLGAVYACSFGKADITTVPEHPTFEADVKPLLAEHCLLCHGYPAKRTAPTDFRLDVYDDADGVRGAKSEASRFVHSVEENEMPPAAAWGDGVGPNGKKLLQNWLADGAPP